MNTGSRLVHLPIYKLHLHEYFKYLLIYYTCKYFLRFKSKYTF